MLQGAECVCKVACVWEAGPMWEENHVCVYLCDRDSAYEIW